MSASDINAIIDQLSQASVDGAAALSFAGRGLKLDSESDGKLSVRTPTAIPVHINYAGSRQHLSCNMQLSYYRIIIIIIIIRFVKRQNVKRLPWR